jgi:hypothetical protein
MNMLNRILLWVSLAIIGWGLTQGSHKASYVLTAIAFIVGVLFLQFKGSSVSVDLDREYATSKGSK